jgi:sigma-B regulation protein RsbU (phosphoserine phosphatase)
MSMNKKILLTIVPVFTISIGAYLVYEIFRTQAAYQKDFDDSIKTSMTILGPALTSNIYNLENFAAQSSIKGIFANDNVRQALAFGEDGNFFAGIGKTKDSAFSEIKDGVKIADYAKKFDYKTQKGFYVYSVSLDDRRYVFPLWSAAENGKKESLGGVFVVEASTKSLKDRILQMVIRLILGLSISLVVAVIFTYMFLQIQIIKPIVKLMNASLDIAGGKFTKLPPPKDRNADEIAMLTDNFNFMVNKIEINLNLIRGISEASQEIVRCKAFSEIQEVFLKHSAKLVHAEKLEIWISTKGQPTEDATSLKRISDNQALDANSSMLQRILSAREVIPLEPSAEINRQGFCVPLINGRGVLLGLIEMYFQAEMQKYGEEEIRIAHGLAVSATTAIENCWRVEEEKDKANMERDLELASAVQDSIVSKNIPTNFNCEVATFYKTAGSCGGDWFGAYEVGKNKLLVLFGDVTGHGTPAALITAVTRGSADMMRNFIMDPKRGSLDNSLPAMALQYLNDCIHGTGRQTYFMTMVAALIDFDTQKIYASSAGHTPPVIITVGEKNSSVKYFYPKGGNRLGFQKGSEYDIQEFDFVPGQQVLFYTDGIIEGENKAGREYGMKKFKQSLEAHGTLFPQDLIKNTAYDAFQYFDGVPPKDDIAMLAIRFLTEAEKQKRQEDEQKNVVDVPKVA